MDADGSNETNLMNDPDAYDMYPSWSPYGESIAFESTRATPKDVEPPAYDPKRIGDLDIWMMRSDGTTCAATTSDLDRLNKFPDWSPNGSSTFREGRLVLVSPNGGREVDLTEQAGIYGPFAAWVA